MQHFIVKQVRAVHTSVVAKSGGGMRWKTHFKRIIGDREQVGYGINGQPTYYDCALIPFPAIRYRAPSDEVRALRAKERGDWRAMSVEDKKQLYRASFRLTFAEFLAPTAEWRSVLGGTLLLISVALWAHVWICYAVYSQVPVPESFSADSIRAQTRRQIDQRTNPIEGLASAWDYEKCDWKKPHAFRQMANPFIDPCTGETVTNTYKW